MGPRRQRNYREIRGGNDPPIFNLYIIITRPRIVRFSLESGTEFDHVTADTLY